MRTYNPKKYEIICGVYCIKNLKNGKYYVGKSDNIYYRWNEHKADLENNKHYNKHLQANKYGKDNFEFKILEECETSDKAYEREKYWIKYFDSFNNGYNQNEGGTGGFGFRHSEETKNRMSKIKAEQMKNYELKNKLADAHESKPIVQINIYTNKCHYWNSFNQAAKELNYNYGGIASVLKGRTNTYMDCVWIYQSDFYDGFDVKKHLKGTDSYYLIAKIYQYKYNGDLVAIWDYDDLHKSEYKASSVYNCCNFKLKSYKNYVWIFDDDVYRIQDIINNYKYEADVYCKPINLYDINNCLLKQYSNIDELSKELKINSYDIRQCCYGIRKSLKGFVFKFCNEEYLYDEGRKIGNEKREKQISKIKRKVCQYDLNMNLIKIWNSITEIQMELHYDRGCIINCCKGRTIQSHGYIWKYLEE